MKFFLIISTIILLPAITFAQSSWRHVSAIRSSVDSYEFSAAKYYSSSLKNQNDESTPYARRIPKEQLDLASIPVVKNQQILFNLFKEVRDHLFLKDNEHDLMRRLTWLYPDDGCWARAQVAADFFMAQNFTPKKIFAFGNLHVNTKNSPEGQVYWWYHVATTFLLHGTAYVMDPAIDPDAPLTLKEWDAAMGGESSEISYSLCHPLTFDPDYSCDEASLDGVAMAISDEAVYLVLEWARLIELGRNPAQELGANPPWL